MEEETISKLQVQPGAELQLLLPSLGFVDSLRAISAFCVFLLHALCMAWGRAPQEGLPNLIITYFNGSMAVAVFIVLSGFSLMYGVIRSHGELKGGARNFFKKRAMRILPAYYACVALSLLVGVLVGYGPGIGVISTMREITWQGVLSHLTLTHLVWGDASTFTNRGDMSVNVVLWSVAVEAWIYMFFPWLVKLWGKHGPYGTTLVVGTGAYVLGAATFGSRFEGLMIHYMSLFVLGMLAAELSFGKQKDVRFPGIALTLVSYFGFCLVGLSGSNAIRSFGIKDLLAAAATLGLLVHLSQNFKHRKVFELKPLVWLGRISYSLYLIHLPLLYLLWKYAISATGHSTEVKAILLTVLGFPVVAGVCWVFAQVFEVPFTSKRR